jgi:hypothetical protein
MIWGERILAGAFGVFGIVWIIQSLGLRYWSEFAPGSGFFPLWLGIILTALVALFLFLSFREPAAIDAPAADAAPIQVKRIGAIIVGLIICIAAIEDLGYGVSVAGYLIYLLGYVERRSLIVTLGAGIGTTLALYLIFRMWLGVPLPQGPWGF